ncbi:MAG: hypothetical protein C0423_05835 [Methylibium sp.]|nr:hypothetical protein [Methylibium sp.]
MADDPNTVWVTNEEAKASLAKQRANLVKRIEGGALEKRWLPRAIANREAQLDVIARDNVSAAIARGDRSADQVGAGLHAVVQQLQQIVVLGRLDWPDGEVIDQQRIKLGKLSQATCKTSVRMCDPSGDPAATAQA